MKKLHLIIILSCLMAQNICSQNSISKMFKAQNYWRPNRGGLNGDLENYYHQIRQSGVTHMRIGGISYDQDRMWSPNDLSAIIHELRAEGFDVIVQVPINPSLSIAANATTCADYVVQINSTITPKVEFWEIGNEPDNYDGTTIHGDYTNLDKIAAYIKSCSVAMKSAVSGQPDIKIIGPSLNAYHTGDYQKLLTPGTNTFIGGLSADGLPLLTSFLLINIHLVNLNSQQQE